MNANLYALVRALRGPIVLITLGVLFWFDQSDRISFGRTWPVLIILIGLMKLIERLLMPPVPPFPPMSTTPPTSVPGGMR
jgi:hypothetical protein